MKYILLSFCIGALLFAPILAQDVFVKEWEKTYSTEMVKEIIQCMDVGDLNNDGTPEIVLGLIVRPHAGLQSYAVQILDHNGTRRQRWDSTYSINDVSIVDVDDDGTPEILVSGADLYVLSNKAQNLNYPPISAVVYTAEAEDLDDDGRRELLVGTRDVMCKSDTITWTTTIGSQIKKILISDINWDGTAEIVVLTGQNVHVLDINGNKMWISPGTQNLRDVAVANIDGDRNVEIMYSTDDKRILIWEAREEGMEEEIHLQSYAADLLVVDDLNKDGESEIVVASSKLWLVILTLEGNSVWEYRVKPIEAQDAFIDIVLADMDGDLFTDVLLAHSVAGMTGGLDSFLYFMKNQWKAPPPSEGSQYFTTALEHFNSEEYTEALDLFTRAQTAFLEEGDQEMADECQTYIDQCKTELTAQEADFKVAQAEALITSGDYEGAETLYAEAKELYQELGDSENVQKCSDRIAEIQDMKPAEEEEPTPEPEKKDSGALLVVALVVAVVAVIVFFVARKFVGRGAPAGKEIPEEPEEIEKIEEIEELEEMEELEELERPSVTEKIREGERDLKAQFVYGEINREEYREKLRKLYEEES